MSVEKRGSDPSDSAPASRLVPIDTQGHNFDDLKLAPNEQKGHLDMRKSLSDFNEKYGDYFSSLTKVFGLDETQMRALISHESRFQINAKNTQGSKGYMQLTSWPIKDIGVRPQLFAPIFAKIDLATIPEGAPKVLKDLVSIFKEGKSSYPKINQLIPSLLVNKNEPYINMTIGLGYAAMLENRLEDKGTHEKITPFVNSRITKLSRGAPFSFVSRRVNDVIPEASVADIKGALKNISTDFELQKDYLQHRDYNGNPFKYSGGFEHRDVYAATLCVISQLAKNNPQLSKRIQ